MTSQEKLEALEKKARENPAHRAWIGVGCCSADGLDCHLTVVCSSRVHYNGFDYLHHGEWLSRATALDRIAEVYY